MTKEICDIGASGWFYYKESFNVYLKKTKKFVTMHGHMNVKFLQQINSQK